ncbi:S8 family serine peptidase [Streptomyces sp. JHA26]|uniref:S8 family serine peptidase n=1 Tax=Streptomyces sp. JHA26 TaxID=1917143 RepID=UPI0025B744B7|nr:S8 family serine peptidase [Streptomyces sp. JHA26]
MRAAGAVVGTMVAVSIGVAPSAAADDIRSKQWYLEPMQAEQMWKASTGEGVKVAVLDSGVNMNTPALKGQVLADEVPKSVAYHATRDEVGHGTSMAELIAGTGAGGGIQGLAPGAKIVPYYVSVDPDGADKGKAPEFAEVLRAVADTDVKIINMSFGNPAFDEEEQAAVEYAASRGKLLVASAGNDGLENGFAGYPVSYNYVLGVSSMNEEGKISKFATRGNYVDLVAPGEDVPTWCDASFQSYCSKSSGTSISSALVSASAALIWSAHPNWTANQVTRALIDTAGRKWPKNDPTQYSGYGTVRPRVVLANPNYDAGAPYSDPLAKWNREKGKKLVTEIPPASAASPSATPPSATGSSQAPENSSGADKAAAGSKADKTENVAAESSSDDNSTLWIALGAAAAVVVIGGGAFVVLRSRRAT